MGNGCAGGAQAHDSGAGAPGTRTVVRPVAFDPKLDRSGTAEALERDPHTIGRWLSAFGQGGPVALIFEQSGGSPPPSKRRSRRN